VPLHCAGICVSPYPVSNCQVSPFLQFIQWAFNTPANPAHYSTWLVAQWRSGSMSCSNFGHWFHQAAVALPPQRHLVLHRFGSISQPIGWSHMLSLTSGCLARDVLGWNNARSSASTPALTLDVLSQRDRRGLNSTEGDIWRERDPFTWQDLVY
jgi:hypothetical protein